MIVKNLLLTEFVDQFLKENFDKMMNLFHHLSKFSDENLLVEINFEQFLYLDIMFEVLIIDLY